MYKIKVNEQHDITLVSGDDGQFTLNGKEMNPDMLEIKPGFFNIILNNQSYNAEVIRHDLKEKIFHIRVNGNVYRIQARDQYDELLHELGMDNMKSKKAADLKAPMPGLVVEVSVSEGMEVKQGDRIIVLEAMKMENVLKAPSDAVIKKINVNKGNAVEKNQVLVTFA